MICAIILAAGRSRRMGTQKLLLPFGGQSVIVHIADQILRGGVEQTIVVVAPDAAALAEALAGRSITLVTNPDDEGDMLSSVRCGLRALPQECEAVLVVLGDQPAVRGELIAGMVHAMRTAGRPIVVPVHQGRRGHPILFSARYRQEVLTSHDGVGLRGMLLRHPEDVLELDVPSDWVLADMDWPEDYRRELERLKESE